MFGQLYLCMVMCGHAWLNMVLYGHVWACILFEICDVVIMLVVKVQQKENRDYRENLKKSKTGFMWNLNYPV